MKTSAGLALIYIGALSCFPATAQATATGAFSKMTCIPENTVKGPDGKPHQYEPYQVTWDGGNKVIISSPEGGMGTTVKVSRLSEKIALMKSNSDLVYSVKLDFEGGTAAYDYGRIDKCSLVEETQRSDTIPLSRVLFVTSYKWYVLGNRALEDDILVFRKYALSVIDDDVAGPERSKNIIDYGCQRTTKYSDYVVFHFPDWVSGSPDQSEWKPRMQLNIGINNLKTTFDAVGEIKNGNIFVDLTDQSKANLLKMMNSESIVLDYGSSDTRMRIQQRSKTPDGKSDFAKIIDNFLKLYLQPSVDVGSIAGFDTTSLLEACLSYKRRGKIP